MRKVLKNFSCEVQYPHLRNNFGLESEGIGECFVDKFTMLGNTWIKKILFDWFFDAPPLCDIFDIYLKKVHIYT